MNKTIVAASFVLVSGLIGAAIALVLVNRGPNAADVQPAAASVSAQDAAPPSHVIAQYRVAVNFPDRFEFDRELDGEVQYIDPQTNTGIVFRVKRLRADTSFDAALDSMVRAFSFDGVVERVEHQSNTRANVTFVQMFRLVTEVVIFEAEDCWGKPLLAYAAYTYDRTTSPEDYWQAQNDSDFPQFEFAYRCPS